MTRSQKIEILEMKVQEMIDLEAKIIRAVNLARKWSEEDPQYAKAWASMAYEYMQDRKRLLGRDYD